APIVGCADGSIRSIAWASSSASPERIGMSKWAPSRTCSPKRAAARRPRFCSVTCRVIARATARCMASFLRSHASLTLGLPLQHERKVDIVQRYHARMQDLRPLPPRYVNDGPIFENVIEGDAVDVLKFPVPRHHEQDKARFIGTADCVVTKDPDNGWYNLGAYRSQVYDGKTVGCQITEGKHGRIHRDKYFARGEPMKVVILCGQDPLLFMLASSPLPEVSEYDIAGGLRGEPIDVVRGPYTGFLIPADCEIAIEGEAVPGETKPE